MITNTFHNITLVLKILIWINMVNTLINNWSMSMSIKYSIIVDIINELLKTELPFILEY